MSIACTAFSLGPAGGAEDTGGVDGADAGGGAVVVDGDLLRNDDGGPVRVRMESSAGLSFTKG